MPQIRELHVQSRARACPRLPVWDGCFRDLPTMLTRKPGARASGVWGLRALWRYSAHKAVFNPHSDPGAQMLRARGWETGRKEQAVAGPVFPAPRLPVSPPHALVAGRLTGSLLCRDHLLVSWTQGPPCACPEGRRRLMLRRPRGCELAATGLFGTVSDSEAGGPVGSAHCLIPMADLLSPLGRDVLLQKLCPRLLHLQ